MAPDAAPPADDAAPQLAHPLSWWRSAKRATTSVKVIDTPQTRVHRGADLVALLATLVGVVVVLLIGVYAEGTWEGITHDIQGISGLLQRILVAPVNIFSGIVTLVLPGVVVIDLALRREARWVAT